MIVPSTPGLPPASGYGTSPAVEQPSDTNLLMAAAQMHEQGRLTGDQPKTAPPHRSPRPRRR